MLRRPPDILITTPESLYLMLTSRARETIADAECVIVDEIHAVAASKRGSHLSLTLERLEELVRANGREEPLQRIGLSATQRPIDEIGRFLGGVSAGGRAAPGDDRGGQADKPLDLQVVVPVADLRDPETDPAADQSDPAMAVNGDCASRRSIWPSIYPRVLEMVREHSSTIVFVNNRRLAERLALRLNDLAEEQVARSHHGSLSREARTEIEDELKSGRLKCLVATSSLELGIDMGAVDLVVQIESPKSVARGLQRVGRAGHTLSQVSKGRLFPKFRADLVECAVVTKLMRERAIEATAIPRSPLDVLAQQVVAMVAGEDWTSTTSIAWSRPRTRTAICRPRSSRTCSTCSTGAIRPRSSPSCGRGWCGTASRARCAPGAARRSSPSRTPARSRTAACTACICRMADAWASSTRRWSTRRAWVRRSASGRRRGGSRTSPAIA